MLTFRGVLQLKDGDAIAIEDDRTLRVERNRSLEEAIARSLLAGGRSISVQVLNEFVNVAHRKLQMI